MGLQNSGKVAPPVKFLCFIFGLEVLQEFLCVLIGWSRHPKQNKKKIFFAEFPFMEEIEIISAFSFYGF